MTGEIVEPFLDGKTLEDALKNKEIYIANLEVMDDVVCKDNLTVCITFSSNLCPVFESKRLAVYKFGL